MVAVATWHVDMEFDRCAVPGVHILATAFKCALIIT